MGVGVVWTWGAVALILWGVVLGAYALLAPQPDRDTSSPLERVSK